MQHSPAVDAFGCGLLGCQACCEVAAGSWLHPPVLDCSSPSLACPAVCVRREASGNWLPIVAKCWVGSSTSVQRALGSHQVATTPGHCVQPDDPDTRGHISCYWTLQPSRHTSIITWDVHGDVWCFLALWVCFGSFSHLVLRLVCFCTTHHGLTCFFSFTVCSVDVGVHLCWCLVQWSDVTDTGWVFQVVLNSWHDRITLKKALRSAWYSEAVPGFLRVYRNDAVVCPSRALITLQRDNCELCCWICWFFRLCIIQKHGPLCLSVRVSFSVAWLLYCNLLVEAQEEICSPLTQDSLILVVQSSCQKQTGVWRMCITQCRSELWSGAPCH